MTELSTFRLYLMRALYLLIFVAMGSLVWPQILRHDASWGLVHGVGASLLGALTAMAALGIRYPVQMLPLLLFEFLWKSIWLLAVAVPLWSEHRLDADVIDNIQACLVGIVLCPIVIPWRYVFTHYVIGRGDRWRPGAA
jgi:hypothetical protein